MAPEGTEARGQLRRWPFALFLLPIGAIAYPPLYNRIHPTMGGLPFFVWYQLVAVVLGAAVTGAVHILRR